MALGRLGVWYSTDKLNGSQLGDLVKTVEGRINQRNVWVRVEQVDPKVTSVKVQTRTPSGGADLDLAHQVEKEIALKLVSSR